MSGVAKELFQLAVGPFVVIKGSELDVRNKDHTTHTGQKTITLKIQINNESLLLIFYIVRLKRVYSF